MRNIIILVVVIISFWIVNGYTEVDISKKEIDEVTTNSRGPPI